MLDDYDSYHLSLRPDLELSDSTMLDDYDSYHLSLRPDLELSDSKMRSASYYLPIRPKL